MAPTARRLLVGSFAVVLVLGVGVLQAPFAAAVNTVTASFSGSTLTISGDGGGGTVRVSHDSGGTIHVFIDGTEVTVTGGPATLTTTDTVDETLTNSSFTIDETNGLFTPGATHAVFFTSSTSSGVDVLTILGQSSAADHIAIVGFAGTDLTGDGNADMNLFANFLSIFGGAGNDVIKLSIQPSPSVCTTLTLPSLIQGGPGDDVITGTGFSSAIKIVGGAGDDTIDAVECSFGQDQATPGSFNGAGGNDTIVGGARSTGTDNIRGGLGADDLTGDACDTPPPCGGSDNIWGGGGNDTIHASDGIHGNDVVRGKAGTDTCTADTGDTVASCETVTLNSVAPRSRSDAGTATRDRIRIQRSGLGVVMTLAG